MGGGTVVTDVAVGLSKGGKPAAALAAACMANGVNERNQERSKK